MGMFRYLCKTSIKKIKNDFAEYKILNRKIADADEYKRIAFKLLIADLGNVDNKVADLYRGCIVRSRELVEKDVDKTSDMIPYEKICSHFSFNYSCKKKDCPCYNENYVYFDAVNRQKNLEEIRSGFWKRKFNRVR